MLPHTAFSFATADVYQTIAFIGGAIAHIASSFGSFTSCALAVRSDASPVNEARLGRVICQ